MAQTLFVTFLRTTGRVRYGLVFTAGQRRLIRFTGLLVGVQAPQPMTLELAYECP